MKKKTLFVIKDYILISFACALMGFTINYFYISNKLAEGGVSGICLILHYLSNIPISYLYLGLNIPLLIIAWKFLGRDFSMKTIYATVSLSFFMDFFSYLRTPIPDFLLASLFGGALTGVSLGLIFISGGSTGGTDIIAIDYTLSRSFCWKGSLSYGFCNSFSRCLSLWKTNFYVYFDCSHCFIKNH